MASKRFKHRQSDTPARQGWRFSRWLVCAATLGVLVLLGSYWWRTQPEQAPTNPFESPPSSGQAERPPLGRVGPENSAQGRLAVIGPGFVGPQACSECHAARVQ